MRVILLGLLVKAYAHISDKLISDMAGFSRSVNEKTTSLRTDSSFLNRLLVPRVSGTKENSEIQEFIINQFSSNLPEYTLELDTFSGRTPHGTKEFTNIIFTRYGSTPSLITLSCHYDSKFFADNPGFVGATDSAAPCAIIYNVALAMQKLDNVSTGVGLQLIFFDGEEAFHEWTDDDSLYGSRHLAQLWRRTPAHRETSIVNLPHPNTYLDQISLFILIDLIGSPKPWPSIHQYSRDSADSFRDLIHIERRLSALGLLSKRRQSESPYFTRPNNDPYVNAVIDDDHRPFQQIGVNVLHIIPAPFPDVWHEPTDDRSALNQGIINDFSIIFSAFIAGWLNTPQNQ